MRTQRFCLVCIGSMALIIGCGGDQGGPTEPPPQPVAGIAVLSGANATDTISTTLRQLLTVEVRGATGAPVAGANVRFTTGSFVSGYGIVHNLSLVADPTATPNARYFVPVYTRDSDADGKVSVLVQLGTTAGNAPIVVDVPALGYVDTVQMKVTPGAATRISIVDTGVVMGSTVQLRASVTDRAGNPRNDRVSFSAASSASGTASVSSNGVVTGGGFGEATVIAEAAGVTDTGYVAVVPSAVLAVFDPGLPSSGIAPGVATVNLDGSGYHWAASATGGSGTTVVPAWGAGGSVVYQAQGPATPFATSATVARLYVVPAGGTATLLNPNGTPLSADERWPAFSAATGATYYGAFDAVAGRWRVWARSSDGTQTAIPTESWLTYVSWPSPSPDASRFAYITTGNFGFGALQVFDLKGGASESWSVTADMARWSPADDRIAFVEPQGGPLKLVNADGTNVRTLTTRTYTTVVFSWSPDGKWIAAKSATGSIDLVDTSTGVAIPLRYLSRFSNPAWK